MIGRIFCEDFFELKDARLEAVVHQGAALEGLALDAVPQDGAGEDLVGSQLAVLAGEDA